MKSTTRTRSASTRRRSTRAEMAKCSGSPGAVPARATSAREPGPKASANWGSFSTARAAAAISPALLVREIAFAGEHPRGGVGAATFGERSGRICSRRWIRSPRRYRPRPPTAASGDGEVFSSDSNTPDGEAYRASGDSAGARPDAHAGRGVRNVGRVASRAGRARGPRRSASPRRRRAGQRVGSADCRNRAGRGRTSCPRSGWPWSGCRTRSAGRAPGSGRRRAA